MSRRPLLRSLLVAASSISVSASPAPAGNPKEANDWRLDAMPPALFQKMFRNHHLVGSPGLAWKKKRVVTVAFNGGSNPLYKLIESTADEWTGLGGQLSFSFKDDTGQYRHWSRTDTTPAADIRIGFEGAKYYSAVGVLAQNVDSNVETMNFGGFPTDLVRYFGGQNAFEWRTSYAHTTILHEFGHAIGLSHEHFNPACQADLKIAMILKYLEGPPNGWQADEAEFNIDAKYYAHALGAQAGPLEAKLITSSETDQRSVMLYVFPSSYYKSGSASPCMPIGDHGMAWPTTLSEGDRGFYLANYQSIASPFGGGE